MCQNSNDHQKKYEQTIADCLPRHSLVATRLDTAGVDKYNFVSWAKALIHDVRDLTRNNRKVLPIYDGYRSHMCIEALEMFFRAGIIAYAHPAHTSGTTQPLDRALFRPWKTHYRKCIDTALADRKRNNAPLNESDVYELIPRAYTWKFTTENVLVGFRAAGLCPLDASQLLGRPCILSETDTETVVDIESMMEMLEEKRKLRSKKLLEEKVVLKNGFIDTSKGIVLTSETAVELLRDELAGKVAKEAIRREKEREKQLKMQEEYADTMAKRLERIVRAMHRRNLLYGTWLVLPRSIAKRREVARARVRRRNNGEDSSGEDVRDSTGDWCEGAVVEDPSDQWAIDDNKSAESGHIGDALMAMDQSFGTL